MDVMSGLVQSRVALIDRGFFVAEGRIVYPTAEGVLVGYDDKTLHVILRGDKIATIFMRDAIRAVREIEDAPAAPEAKE